MFAHIASMFTYADEPAAAIGTAQGTWALFWATLATFIATTLAVITALWLPAHERSTSRKEKVDERRKRNQVVFEDFKAAVALVHNITNHFKSGHHFQEIELWNYLNRIAVWERVINHHFGHELSHHLLPRSLAAASQALYETRDIIKKFMEGAPNSGATQYLRVTSNNELEASLRRVVGAEAMLTQNFDLGRNVT